MKLWLTTVLLFFTFQNGYDLFQQALIKERAEGKIEEAARMYEQIVKNHAGDRGLVAKALAQLGQVYEKLGNPDARKTYERVVREFADQTAAAADARQRLAVLQAAKPSDRPATRRVWAAQGIDLRSGASTDGRLFAFTDWATGDLAAIEFASGKQRRLTHKGGWSESSDYAQSPVISHDGKLIAYSWWIAKQGNYELRVLGTAEGSEPRTLYSNPEVLVIFPQGWSADGKKLLVSCWRTDGTTQIAMLNLDGGTLQVVKSLGRHEPGNLSLSPDSRYIAYDFPQADEGPERDILLLASDGSREVPLVRHAGHDVAPMWTPDGNRVLFFSDRSGTLGLWSVSVAGGRVQGAPALIQANGGQMSPIGFNRSGSLYYLQPSGANDLLAADIDLETGRFLSEPETVVSRFGQPSGRPAWSPDGRHLAYAVNTPSRLARSGPMSVVVRDMQTGRERAMNQSFDTLGTLPKWRPDGKTLLVYGRTANGPVGAFQLDVADGSANPIPGSQNWENGCTYPQWSTTSDGIWCHSKSEGGIIRRQLISGEETGRVRFDDTSANTPVSPDGRWVAFRSKDLRTLWVASVETGEQRELFRQETPKGVLTPLSWTPDSRYVLCLDGERQVWRIPASGGEARKLAIPLTGLSHLVVHPDGKRVAIRTEEPGSEVWTLENFLPPKASR